MKTIKYYFFILGIILSLNSFAQNKICTGAEYSTNQAFFRATSNGNSIDVTASKKKALSNARIAIVSQITTKVEGAIQKQDCEDMYKKKMIALAMIAIRQEAGNMKVICENSSQNNQKYASEVVVEISKDNIIKSITAQITGDNTLKNRFNIDKFKNSL